MVSRIKYPPIHTHQSIGRIRQMSEEIDRMEQKKSEAREQIEHISNVFYLTILLKLSNKKDCTQRSIQQKVIIDRLEELGLLKGYTATNVEKITGMKLLK